MSKKRLLSMRWRRPQILTCSLSLRKLALCSSKIFILIQWLHFLAIKSISFSIEKRAWSTRVILSPKKRNNSFK